LIRSRHWDLDLLGRCQDPAINAQLPGRPAGSRAGPPDPGCRVAQPVERLADDATRQARSPTVAGIVRKATAVGGVPSRGRLSVAGTVRAGGSALGARARSGPRSGTVRTAFVHGHCGCPCLAGCSRRDCQYGRGTFRRRRGEEDSALSAALLVERGEQAGHLKEVGAQPMRFGAGPTDRGLGAGAGDVEPGGGPRGHLAWRVACPLGQRKGRVGLEVGEGGGPNQRICTTKKTRPIELPLNRRLEPA
jgi:hypothetical protein